MTTRATKAALKAREKYIQYSKKMASRVTIFWMVYRIIISILVFFRPEVATAMTRLTEGVDTIMIVNMSVYTGNSATEKIAIAFGKRKTLYNDDDDDDKDEEDEEEEEENG